MKRYNNLPSKGRPKLSDNVRKSIVVPVKYDPDKYRIMLDKASLAGLNRSEYIRQSSIKCNIVERLKPKDVRAIRSLQHIEDNLNRIAKFCASILKRGSTSENLIMMFRDMNDCRKFVLDLIRVYRNTPDNA